MHKRSTLPVILLLAFILITNGCGRTPTPTSNPATPIPSAVPDRTRIVGYYAAWTAGRGAFVAGIAAEKLTHLNYAFSNVSKDGKCILGDPKADVERIYTAKESVSGAADPSDSGALRGNFNQLKQLKLKYPGLQTLISVGGWSWSSNFSDAALSEASRQAFAKSCIELYLVKYKGVFDGIDIDWEFPVSGGLTPGKPEDKQNFTLLLAELRKQLDALGSADGRHYLLTIAAPAGPESFQHFERDKIAASLDWINLMTYDFHGIWDVKTNFNAPLFKTSAEPSSPLNNNSAVQNYLKAGIPPEKLVMGVPFYGKGWKGVPAANNGLYQTSQGGAPGSYGELGAFDYKDLKQNYMSTYTRFWDEEAKVPWLYNPQTGIFISYEDPESMAAKAAYVKTNHLGGMMIWELSQDDGSLLDTLYHQLKLGSASIPATPKPQTIAKADKPGAGVFFDDFKYTGPDDPALRANAWDVRTSAGGPGASEAGWSAQNVSFVDDPAVPGNRVAQLAASSDGTPKGTQQAEISQVRKFFEGTYASRVRFSDNPAAGPDGDAIVETFFAITPLKAAMDPDYGEMDFEYLPNGGWDKPGSNLWMTTWETYQENPWKADNTSTQVSGSLDGWHTLIIQVGGGEVKYFVDGKLLATHGGKYYPETPLSLDYNVWFIQNGLVQSTDARRYVEQVDWVYYAGNETLNQTQVEARVAHYRTASQAFDDQVLAWIPVTDQSPTATPAPAHAAGAPRPFEAKMKKVSTIQVDGKLDDWPSTPDFTLNDKSKIVWSSKPGNWGGPKDFSTQAWAGWADDGLYFAFKVTDDKHVQTESGKNLWHGDYVELQFDTQLEKDYDVTDMDGDDYQLGISPGDFGSVPAATVAWFGPVDEVQMKLVKQAQIQTADGYILEIFIPKGLLQGITLSDHATFGMNINPSDADDPQEGQKIMMSTSRTRTLTDPTTFGKIVLMP